MILSETTPPPINPYWRLGGEGGSNIQGLSSSGVPPHFSVVTFHSWWLIIHYTARSRQCSCYKMYVICVTHSPLTCLSTATSSLSRVFTHHSREVSEHLSVRLQGCKTNCCCSWVRLANCNLRTKSALPSVFVNKALSEHSHQFTNCLWLPS